MFWTIIPFVFFALFSITLCRVSKKAFGFCLPVSMIMSVMIIYLSQVLMSSFSFGYLIIFAIAGMGGLLCVQAKRDAVFKNTIFSTGFFIYIFIFILFFIIDYNRHFTTWDELSHWGLMVKEMLRLDRFYTDVSSNLIPHRDYLPFPGLLELLWVQLSGAYREGVVSMGLHVFIVSSIILPLADAVQNRASKNTLLTWASLTLIVIWIMVSFDPTDRFKTIYVEFLFPAIFLYIATLIITKECVNTIGGYFFFIFASVGLIMSKQVAFVFWLLIEIMFIVTLINEKKSITKENLIKIAISISVPILALLSWSLYIKSQGISIGGDFGVDIASLKLKDIVGILFFGKGEAYQVNVIKNFWVALFSKSIFTGTLQITVISGLLLSCALLAYLWFRFGKRINLLLFITVFVLGTIGYSMMILATYVFVFPKEDAVELVMFDRYMSSYLVAEFIFCLICSVWMLKDSISIARAEKWFILLVVCCIILDPTRLINLTPQYIIYNGSFFKYEAEASLLDILPSGSHVYIMCNGEFGYDYFIQYYKNEVHIDMVDDLVTYNFASKEYVDELISEIRKNDYLLVTSIDDDSNNQIKAYIDLGTNLKSHMLYKIEKVDESIKLLEMNE